MTESECPPIRLCICCQETELAITQRQTCTGCLNHTRIDLNAIVDGYALLPSYLHAYSTRSPGSGEGGSRNAETPLMGGDVLSLIAYGSDGYNEAMKRGLQRENGQPFEDSVEQPWSDPPSVLFELERWEAALREDMGLHAATTKATISNVTSFLHEHLTWAAQNHPAFDDFARELRQLRGHVDRALGRSDRPVFANCACLDCGERLARRWTISGLEDDWTCLGCRRTYTESDYYLAVEEHQMKAQKRGTA